MKKGKLVYSTLLFFIFFLPVASYGNSPGNRPDKSSWFSSLESQILKLEKKLRAVQKEYQDDKKDVDSEYQPVIRNLKEEKKGANSLFGLPFVKDTKKDYEEEITETRSEYNDRASELRIEFIEHKNALKNDLENALASPGDKKVKDKIDKIKPDSGSREALEAYNSCKNLQNVLQIQIAELRSDPSNYELAENTYTTQENLCKTVISMNSQFKSRIDTKYIPRFKNLIRRIDSIENELNQPNIDKNIVANQKEKMKKIENALIKGIDQLNAMKPGIDKRIKTLQNYLKTVSLLKRSAGVAKDASAIISTINEQFAQLDIVMPEIISYDLKEGDFQLNLPAK